MSSCKWIVVLLIARELALAPGVRAQRAASDTSVSVSTEVTLRVIDVGPRNAQPIVLIPGWCFTADIWNAQIDAFRGRYRIIAIDPRSQGRSTILDHSNSPDDRATDLAKLLAAMHLRKPILVGWSQGVQDVAAYVLKFGASDIGGIVLVDAKVSAGASSISAPEAAQSLQLMSLYSSAPRSYLEGMMGYIFKRPLSKRELDDIVTSALRTPSSVGVANLVLDELGKDYRLSLAHMTVPALVIVAGTAEDKDQQLRQPIPNATFAVVPNAGHAVFHDEPRAFNALLATFAERIAKLRQ